MQWLIDIIIDLMWNSIHAEGIYHERATGLVDYSVTHFTRDGAWHTLDLSSIIPEHAKSAQFHLRARSANVADDIKLRRLGQDGDQTFCVWRPEVANVFSTVLPIVALDADRKIEYKIPGVSVSFIILTVKGWWL